LLISYKLATARQSLPAKTGNRQLSLAASPNHQATPKVQPSTCAMVHSTGVGWGSVNLTRASIPTGATIPCGDATGVIRGSRFDSRRGKLEKDAVYFSSSSP
jgi:hypothetical protein